MYIIIKSRLSLQNFWGRSYLSYQVHTFMKFAVLSSCDFLMQIIPVGKY